MKVAITGATGLLGANLATHLREAGHTVSATKRETSDTSLLDGLDLDWHTAPLHDVHALTRAFDGCDWVFHCAARTSVLPRVTRELADTNIHGTDNVVRACKNAGIGRLVHTSSTTAVGVSERGIPCDENQPWNLAKFGLDDGYATTKYESERRVLQATANGEIDAVVVNPGFMFGPLDAGPSSGRMILEVADGNARVHTPGRNSFVHVASVVRSMVAAAEKGRTGERYILGGENLTYGEIFSRIAAVVGKPPPIVSVPYPLAWFAGLYGDWQYWRTGEVPRLNSTTIAWGFETGFAMDSRKAKNALGHDPDTADAGIEAAWAWFRDRSR